jgi:hypothetical protein
MTAPAPICPVCGKPVTSHDGAAKVGDEVVHGGCYIAKAKRDAETRFGNSTTSDRCRDLACCVAF